MSWVLIPSTNKRGESGPQISCGKTYKLSCQQIPWGRVIFGGYNFASFTQGQCPGGDVILPIGSEESLPVLFLQRQLQYRTDPL